jgi:transposase
VQDRDAAPGLIREARKLFPFISCIFADGAYAGDKLAGAIADQPVHLEIVKRSDQAKGFVVIARRWVVERTFSWLRRNRRLAADFENLCLMAEAFIKMAMIALMLRRLARLSPAS